MAARIKKRRGDKRQKLAGRVRGYDMNCRLISVCASCFVCVVLTTCTQTGNPAPPDPWEHQVRGKRRGKAAGTCRSAMHGGGCGEQVVRRDGRPAEGMPWRFDCFGCQDLWEAAWQELTPSRIAQISGRISISAATILCFKTPGPFDIPDR